MPAKPPVPRAAAPFSGGRLGLLAAATLLVVVGVELTTWALFSWPGAWVGRIPGPLERPLRAYHSSFVAGAPIQYRAGCSEPDPELLYRLKPGACRFASGEFDTAVRVSGRHLREDGETADPDVVVLGDSYSLGWGVDREAAYPAILARRLGLREVVAAHSSYGTVRELLLLRRLALADFRAVVLQYAQNDAVENRSFLRSGRHVPSSLGEYQKTVDLWARISDRWFLARTRNWFSLVRWSFRHRVRDEPWPGPAEQARTLLEVLSAFASDLRARPVLVFAADMGRDGAEFFRTLDEARKPPGLGPVVTLDAARSIEAPDLFVLDAHWRRSGHEKVAAALASGLERLRD
jgi:hypothetical protein